MGTVLHEGRPEWPVSLPGWAARKARTQSEHWKLLRSIADLLWQDLLALPGVTQEVKPRFVPYYHLLLDRHQLLIADGAAAESLHPGPLARASLLHHHRTALESAFAPWQIAAFNRQPAVRRILRGYEASVLIAGRLLRARSEVLPVRHLAA